MWPPESTVNGVTTNIDRETNTLLDTNKTFDNVNKKKFDCESIYKCDIFNMYHEYMNLSVALSCYHNSGSDFARPPNALHINNNFVKLSKRNLSLVDNHRLNCGFVNTYDNYHGVESYNEPEHIVMPCYLNTATVAQNCHKFDYFSESNNYATTSVQDADDHLTYRMGCHGSPAWDPLGCLAHRSVQLGCKHKVDIFTAIDKYETDTLALVFIHASVKDDLWGWHYLSTGAGSSNLLFRCNSVPLGPLQVSCSMDIYLIEFASNLQFSPKNAYQDYLKDYQTRTYYNMAYTTYMENIVDMLIGQANCVEPSFSDVVKPTSCSLNNPIVPHSDLLPETQELVSNTYHSEVTKVNVDNNCPEKSRGFLNHSKADFTFIGPDREPVLISDIDQCVAIAKLIQQTGKPNNAAARIPLVSGLNLEAWHKHLADYHDQYLLQYLTFGFPLSLSDPDELNNTHVSNHASALQYPQAIQQYLDKECKAGAMIGTFQKIPDPGFHCSPMLTRPKDKDKRRVIMNLSHPHGSSLNDHVDGKAFDNRPFTLRFSTIDDIATTILATEDPVIFKIDISRAF